MNDFGLYTKISSIFVVVKFILKKISIHFHLLFFMIWDTIHLMINGCFCFSQLITYLIYYTCCSDDRVNRCSTFTGRIHLTLSYILKSFAGFFKDKIMNLVKKWHAFIFRKRRTIITMYSTIHVYIYLLESHEHSYMHVSKQRIRTWITAVPLLDVCKDVHECVNMVTIWD